MIKLKTTLTLVFIYTCFLSSFSAVTYTTNPPVVGCVDTFKTSITGTSYSWNFGPNAVSPNTATQNAAVTFLSTASVTVKVTIGTTNGPVVDSAVVTPTVIANLSFTPILCYHVPPLKDTATISAGGNPSVHYLWSNNSTSSSTLLDNGPFSVTVTNTTTGCSVVFNDTIHVDPQISNTNILTLYRCANPAHGDLQLDGKGGMGQLTYRVAGVGTDTTGYFPNLSPGTYTFFITDTLGCSLYGANNTITIPNSIASDSFVVSADSTTCFGFDNGQVVITPKNPDDGPFVYSIDGGPFNFPDTFPNVGGGVHTVQAKSFLYGCVYDYSANVGQPAQHVLNINPDTVNTIPGALDTVTTTTDFVNPVYSWTPIKNISCDTCSSPVITADTVNTVYTLKVYSARDTGCYASDSVIIVVKPPVLPDSLLMPSAFTPNGDGKNDVFGPVKASAYTNPTIKIFRIYNRWGQLVYNGTDYWDGRFDGKAQPVGTYVYYIEVQYPALDNSIPTYKKEGSVTLLR